jgi:Zn-dependent peptidase ImmA (M78 family)
MTKQSKEVKLNIIRELRALVPHRPLTFSEAYMLAEKQAHKALQLLGQTEPDVNLGFILDHPRIVMSLEPRHRMGRIAGLTTVSKGKYFIMVNKNDVHPRRRFTLGHEFKHVLDYTLAPVIYRNLGYGDAKRRDERIEVICHYFSACLLMPRTWLKRVWANGIQDVSTLAAVFQVSEEAMERRLKFLGYIDDDPKPLKAYFRKENLALAA